MEIIRKQLKYNTNDDNRHKTKGILITMSYNLNLNIKYINNLTLAKPLMKLAKFVT